MYGTAVRHHEIPEQADDTRRHSTSDALAYLILMNLSAPYNRRVPFEDHKRKGQRKQQTTVEPWGEYKKVLREGECEIATCRQAYGQ